MDLFPRLYALDSSQDCKLVDRWHIVDGYWGGNWHWRRPPRGRANNDVMDLVSMIGNLSLSSASTDRWSWSKDASGIYKDIALGTFAPNGCSLSNKAMHGVFQSTFWGIWNWRNKIINAQQDRVDNIKQEDISPSIQRISKIWISARASSRPANWNCWIARPFDLFGAV
ncbi:hypothetical protein Tco_1178473 [Tanacetum coccineum]